MRSQTHFRARCPSLAFWLLLLGITVNAIAADAERGYTYQSKETIKVKVTLLVAGEDAPYKPVEAVSWEIEVKPGSKFQAAVDFLPLTRSQYERLREGYARKGMPLPRVEFLLSGRVLRGIDRVVVAKSSRRIDWPKDFQLKDGDIVQIYEVADP